MRTIAVIPAGGAGRRLGATIAKQFIELYAQPILAHTLRVFQNTAVIDEIIVVVPEEDIISVRERIIGAYALSKVTTVVAGGRERQDSVRCGLHAIAAPCDYVVIHDGVRPFVTMAMIERCLAAAMETGAACAGVRAKDTVKEADIDHTVTATLERHRLWLAQTPQVFALDLIRKAHDVALQDQYVGTDDASLAERIGVSVRMVDGADANIKITTQEDLAMAEAFMNQKQARPVHLRTGLGYDSHRFAAGRKLILGGVEIPFELGLQGHSDADALIHAMCDALLGAAGLGDIGRHFPDTDPAYKNISSLVLLARVKQLLSDAGLAATHIDATVMMEKPKLAPHAAAMADNIARVLAVPVACISIKAKTNEGMGFVGQMEGVAVWAVANVTTKEKE
ncbi:MAG: 2-C-methyl-D-erythritol 4-phosphate cytidylyltransferase [Smithellaceae bacterium]